MKLKEMNVTYKDDSDSEGNAPCSDVAMCASISCPFAFTDESERVQNYGCLPGPFEILQMRVKHGKTWACHSNPKKPCLGGLRFIKEQGYDSKVIDFNLVTEETGWHQYA